MQRETSGVTTGLVLRYVEERAGADGVAELLRRAQVPVSLEQLRDETSWVSYDVRIRLFEAAVEVLGDPMCTFAMGEAALRTGLNHSLVLVLRSLGSPAVVYQQIPRAVPKFSTTSTMEVLECGPTHATLRYSLREGYQHSRLDCLYAQGLITLVPQLFGLPSARLVHDECESDGAPACVYHLTWPRRRRWWRPSSAETDRELQALRGQLEALQLAAADLVAGDDVQSVVESITSRAAEAVLAPAHLLAVTRPGGGPALVRAQGLDGREAERLAGRLLAGQDLGAGAVVVPVASSRREHGYLAALYPEGQQGPGDERALLQAYARHAAAALDLLLALEKTRRDQSRSEALLQLAHELRSATDEEEIAEVVARLLPDIAGCDTSSVLYWQPESGALRPASSAGLTSAQHELFVADAIRADDTPELVEMLTRHEPTVITDDQPTPVLRDLLRALDIQGCAVAPLLGQGALLGVVTAGWRPGSPPDDVEELLHRLEAVTEYATTSVLNARLLARVRHQSLHDGLTALPNRELFRRTLGDLLSAAGDADGVAVLFCDLDRFKRVNDELGHAAGDELLRQVAARLRAVLRPADLVGRLSGDEFALLLPGVTDGDAAARLAQRVVACFQEPFRVEGQELGVTTSVGVALHRGPGGRVDTMLRQADRAMYEAKQRGRNQVARAEHSWPAPSPRTLPASLEAELVTASRDPRDLVLFFQPLVALPVAAPDAGLLCLDSVRVVGVEALVRWQHPRLGLLRPAEFLPLAEEIGVICELDLWALRAACAAVAQHDGQLGVAVNLSSATLLDGRLADTVRAALADSGLAPHRLHVEVVESRSLLDVPAAADQLVALRRLGVRVALDDFGTGYSTLSWLQTLPIDQLKLDRTFTATLDAPRDGSLAADSAATSLVRGVRALAGALGVDVVAEGVETESQLRALAEAGYRLFQGYLFGRPAPELPAADGPPLVVDSSLPQP